LEDFTVKKEDLIKKAAERGIAIDETTAEKYINLSDEELANLDISGGCTGSPFSKVTRDNYCSKGIKGWDITLATCKPCAISRKTSPIIDGINPPYCVYQCNETGWIIASENV
jgi:hypothetical protein